MKFLLGTNPGRAMERRLHSGLPRMSQYDDAFSFKKHPQIYFTHRPIDPCLDLERKHQFEPRKIEQARLITILRPQYI